MAHKKLEKSESIRLSQSVVDLVRSESVKTGVPIRTIADNRLKKSYLSIDIDQK